MVKFYRRFLSHIMTTLAPMDAIITLAHGQLQAFNVTKDALANATMLHYPHLTAEYILMVNASDHAISAVLQEPVNNYWRRWHSFPSASPQHGSATAPSDRTAKHFCHAVEGRRFMVYTDHKPLTHAFARPSNNLNDLVLKQPPDLIIPIKATPLEI
ncbi:Retrovirus-related Pol polyprotein from transposon [Trichinella zimbabwensis]|uniref:Retrovirus-related Pol polyprotein from transposon n=1 Tax=Trichinella zimbabwensis TaxID=268475 RepID=A0A0V1HLZ8_9BILA|nr:Retrovirus-related Pol polyprotein from transposon [Trichinella zimbabwensis]